MVRTEIRIGKRALGVQDAKKLLGWEEVEKGTYHLVDHDGNKVICKRNVKNRPIYRPILKTLEQEILRKRWRFNGEPIIIGAKGTVLNGQHTLISLVLANQTWEQEPDRYPWSSPPKIDKLVVYGVQETDSVVNTMDTCKPRSLADVIYRSKYLTSSAKRKKAARAADHAIRILWHRTGVGLDAFAPRRTHAESLDFLERHPSILQCIQIVIGLEQANGLKHRLTRWCSLGYCAGLLYLMGASATDTEKYRADPQETNINWRNKEKAESYFRFLAETKSEELKGSLASALGILSRPLVRWSILILGWHKFLKGGPNAVKDIQLEIEESMAGRPVIIDPPIIGGIDVGEPIVQEEWGGDPSPEEILRRAEEIRRNGAR